MYLHPSEGHVCVHWAVWISTWCNIYIAANVFTKLLTSIILFIHVYILIYLYIGPQKTARFGYRCCWSLRRARPAVPAPSPVYVRQLDVGKWPATAAQVVGMAVGPATEVTLVAVVAIIVGPTVEITCISVVSRFRYPFTIGLQQRWSDDWQCDDDLLQQRR